MASHGRRASGPPDSSCVDDGARRARAACRGARRAGSGRDRRAVGSAWCALATTGVLFPWLEMYGAHRVPRPRGQRARRAHLRRRAAPGDDATGARGARADTPSRDVLRAGREGAPPSRRRARDSRRRPHPRRARRSPRSVALLPHAVVRARRDRPGRGRGRSRDGRAAPLLPPAARPHERHDRPRRAPRGGHARRLVVARLRRHPRAKPRGRRGARRPNARPTARS